jgi:cysteinyl-tRNA synthetase
LAYVSPGGVYLSVEAVDGYGLLGHQSLDSLRSGARVEPDSSKRSPLDFALWKAAKPGEPSWDSPFGPGRPGWHTECVVMSLGLLGEDFDIHGGAIDLIFPHHENERAQAVALGRRFARHWVHNGWVEVGGEKMSKSLGNFTSLDDLLARTDARAYRLLVLRSHYRSPIEVTPRTVADAEEALARLDGIARRFGLAGGPPGGPRPATAPHGVSRMGRQRPDVPGAGTALEAAASYVERFVGHMDDDLDTPGALAGIFELARAANAAADAGDGTGAEILASTAQDLCSALGLELSPGSQEVDALSAGLAAERDQARARRDFQRADELREQLAELGWTVEDSQEGTRLRRSDRPGAS